MELRHLRYFAAVAAHGSFSRAAAHLHLTQPALSRQVRDLEEELGVPLFVRGTNAVSLTGAGEVFYEEARDLLTRADLAVQRVRGEIKGEVLRVGYAPSLLSGIMPRAIEKFQAAAPRVRLELADLSPREMSEQAAAGQLDLVLTAAGTEAANPEFQWQALRQLNHVLVMPRAHPLTKLKKIPPSRLRGEPILALSRVSYPEYAPRLRAVLKPFGITPNIVAQTADGISSLFAEMEARMAVTILSDGIANVLPRALELRPFSPALAPTEVVAGLPAVRPSPHAERFLKLLLAEVTVLTRTG